MEQPPSGSLAKSTFSSGQNRKVNKTFKPASKTAGSIPLPDLPKICLQHLIISAKLPKRVYIQFPLPLKTPLSQVSLTPRFPRSGFPVPSRWCDSCLRLPAHPSKCRQPLPHSVLLYPLGLHGGVRDAGCGVRVPSSPRRPGRRSARSDGSERPPKPVRPSRADHPSCPCADGPPPVPITEPVPLPCSVLSPRHHSGGTGLPPAPGGRGAGRGG